MAKGVLRVTEPVPGVRRFEMARRFGGVPVYWTSCFLVGDTLIDTGHAHQGPELLRALADPIRTGKVRRVLVTHHHEDHTGNLAPIHRATGASVMAPEYARGICRARRRLPTYRRLTWGQPEDFDAGPLPDHVLTSVGGVDVIATPGHTPGDVAFHDPDKRWLFCGDLVLGATQTVMRPNEDVAAVTSSTERLAGLHVDHVFGSHRVVTERGGEHLRRRVAFLHEAREQVHELVADEPALGARPEVVAQRLWGHDPLFLRFFSGGDFSRAHFARSLMAMGGRR